MAALPAQGGHRRFGEPPGLRAHAEGIEPDGVVEQFGAALARQRQDGLRSGDQARRVDVSYGECEPVHDAGRRPVGREPGRVRQVFDLHRPAAGVLSRLGGLPRRSGRGHLIAPRRGHCGLCPVSLARDDGDRVGPASGQDTFGGVGLAFLGEADSQPAGGLRTEETPPAGLLPDRLPQQRDGLRPVADEPLEIAAEQRRLGAVALPRGARAVVVRGLAGGAGHVGRAGRAGRVGRVGRVGRGPEQPEIPYNGGQFRQMSRAGPARRSVLGERYRLFRTSGQGAADREDQAGRGDARSVRGTAQDPLGDIHGRAGPAAEEQHQRVCAVQRGQVAGSGRFGSQGGEFVGGAGGIAVGPAAVLGERDLKGQPCVRLGRLGACPFQDLPGLRDVTELDQRAGQRDGGGARPVKRAAREAAGEFGVVPVGRLGRERQQIGVDRAVGVQLPAGAVDLVRLRHGQGARGEEGAREAAAAQQGQPLACGRAQHRPAQPHQDLASGLGGADEAPCFEAFDDVRGHLLQDGQGQWFAEGDGVEGIALYGAEAVQLAVEQLGKSGRHGQRAAPPPQAARLLEPAGHAGVPDQFGHEQRVSAGPPEQEVHGGPRRLAVHQRAYEPSGVGAAERCQVQALQVLVLPQRDDGVGHLQAGAGGDHQAQAPVGGQTQDQGRGPLVEAVDVVDDEHRGALSGAAAQFAPDQAIRAAVVQRGFHAAQSAEHAEGNPASRLGRRGPDDFEPGGVEQARHRGEQCRLSHSGGPDHRRAPFGQYGSRYLFLFVILGDQHSGTQVVRHCFSPVQFPRTAFRTATQARPTAPRHRGCGPRPSQLGACGHGDAWDSYLK
ncbi:hypothetical protein GCM10012286_36210 [Streptomyces lasiicapitis]|uniref:Uncharacterized protein n=1 Tax=Streptomyces lasiicapitis TaxID=1923961 RepID=A0ABQ2M2U7_9ACTN|nr:hypothetical protein GCM10012286_36210 [Streptomyces lasiicapitis]